MLNTKVVSNDAVHSCAAVVQVIFRQYDQNSIFSLLALDEDCVAAEEPKSLHGVVGEADDGIVVIDSVGNTVATYQHCARMGSFPCSRTHIKEFGFFFFFSIAVAVSSTWIKSVHGHGDVRLDMLTSFFSAPDASLVR